MTYPPPLAPPPPLFIQGVRLHVNPFKKVSEFPKGLALCHFWGGPVKKTTLYEFIGG